jgi:hypothetical protein
MRNVTADADPTGEILAEKARLNDLAIWPDTAGRIESMPTAVKRLDLESASWLKSADGATRSCQAEPVD